MEDRGMIRHDNELDVDASEIRYIPREQRKRKVNCFRLGMGILAVAFLATLVVVALAKLIPHAEKSITAGKKGDVQEVLFKAVFTTNYIPGSNTQSLMLTNIGDINNQIITKAQENRLQVLNAFFHSRSTSKRMKCTNPLSGNLLQLDIVTLLPSQCLNGKENTCKIQLQNKLKDIFIRMSTISLMVQFDDDRSESISMKLCDLMELIDDDDEEEMAPKQEQVQATAAAPIDIKPKLARNYPLNNAVRSAGYRSSGCSLCINKIGRVELPGEFGTRIDDNTLGSSRLYSDRNEPYMIAKLYEESSYRLDVKLNCGNGGQDDNPCSNSLMVIAWIDFNDNNYDDGESRVLQRGWSQGQRATGVFYLNINVSSVDGRTVRDGLHRLRLTVRPSDEYQRECGNFQYEEVKDYQVEVIRKRIITTTPAPPVCPLSFARIILVLMAGEKGTQIRDDRPKNNYVLNDPRQHHMSITLFERTIYLIRIQLDCSTQLRTDLTPTGCNLAQDVAVAIDLNNDGRFDESEIGSPYRWPVTSYMAEGIYDLQIHVPAIDSSYARNEPHLMRIVVIPSTYYKDLCGFSEYREVREYSINIIPKVKYSTRVDAAPSYPIPRDFECASDVGKILLVVMAGEYRTQIRDDPSTKAVMNRDNRYERHLTIILYEDTVYLLRIQLECTRLRGRDYYRTNCTLPHDVYAWIDLNDDGNYDDTENASPYRWPVTSYIPEGIYDLQLYIPIINGRNIKTGPHRMRLAVTLDEQYRKKCGNNYYTESREYNVTIVRYNTRPEDTGVSYLPLSDNVCSQSPSKVVLVIMTGELGTHIRDDTPMNTLVGPNQNRHHLAVTLYDNTIYRIRIQLDCDRPTSKGTYDTNCNLAKEVTAWIDLNNNEQFEDNEISFPNRWPLRTSVGLGLYDFEIAIPSIDGRVLRSGTHRVRISVSASKEYQDKCGRTGNTETREYTFNIIERPANSYSWVLPGRVPAPNPAPIPAPIQRIAHCSVGNLACSAGHNAISSVRLYGEQNTAIDDTTKQCSATDNYNDRRNLVATLFDSTTYTLQIELYCAQQWGFDNSDEPDSTLSGTTCNHKNYLDVWIDFDNNGVFDEYNERITTSDGYDDDNYKTRYDISINVPQIDGRNSVDGTHQMRIILRQDEQNRQPCYNSGSGEARDYTLQIRSKRDY